MADSYYLARYLIELVPRKTSVSRETFDAAVADADMLRQSFEPQPGRVVTVDWVNPPGPTRVMRIWEAKPARSVGNQILAYEWTLTADVTA